MLRPVFHSFLGRFVRDRRGVSAVEFALIAPTMILIYLALTEFSQVYMAERRAGHAASMMTDLVAQSASVTAAGIDQTFGIGEVIMRPFSSDQLSMRVSSLTMKPDGKITVDWSRNNNKLTRLSEVKEIPPNLIAPNESLIMGEISYRYRLSIGEKLIDREFVLERKYYLRPRTVNTVTCADC
ncbi:TadE/TadG family type IV pilus assembly protein [Brevundimonas faecalis]|uniref:TadE/TadG family type IV pilus assembly protein n=1 Tax=Brevundimonas faecalis TaxID=947378 RepID=UPI003612DC03